jgi:hypothetical protein
VTAARDLAEALRSLVASLPKCRRCGVNPAALEWSGDERYCDEHAAPDGYTCLGEGERESSWAPALREAVRVLAAWDAEQREQVIPMTADEFARLATLMHGAGEAALDAPKPKEPDHVHEPWVERSHVIVPRPVSAEFIDAFEAAGGRPELVASLRKERNPK